MITPVLKNKLNEIWEDCWPVSDLRPLALLDLLSYIFFVKKIFDRELIGSKNKYFNRSNISFIYSEDLQEFTWSKLRNLNPPQIQDLFTKEDGIINLMIQYGNSGNVYSEFFKAAPILTPTSRLLSNVIQIVNIIETSDKIIQASIIEYFINKGNIITQNGQVYLPENISWLMVETAEPLSKDIIIDPSAGNGNLLVDAANYLTAKNKLYNSGISNVPKAETLKGFEADPVQIRIAGLNMILHDIKNPQLEILNVSQDNILSANSKPALFISNLFFTEVESSLPVTATAVETGLRKDIFFLNLILKNISSGSRAVILVPELFLFSRDSSFADIRRNIVDNNKLEGVISLPSKGNSLISRAGILIFNNHESIITENVWFFKMKPVKEKSQIDGQTLNNNSSYNELDFSKDGVNDISFQWKNRKTAVANNTDNSYYVTVHDLTANNYILNFDDYKAIAKKREADKIDADKKLSALTNEYEYTQNNVNENFSYEPKKSKRKALYALIVFLLLAAVATAVYFYNFKKPGFSFLNSKSVTDSIKDTNQNISSKKISSSDSITTPSGGKPIAGSTIKNSNINSPLPGISKGYTVIDTAYFYWKPDLTKRKKVYLIHRNGYVLHPKEEQNGFVYIIYINKRGVAKRGWVNKQHLQPFQ